MIQRKILCKDIPSAYEAIRTMDGIISDTRHKCALITLYEKGFARGEIESLIKKIKELGHPELKIAGISLTLIAELMPEGTGVLMNLILTEEADIDVITVPCFPGGEKTAAQMMKERLHRIDDVKAVELFGSNMALDTTAFMEKAMEGHEDAVLFGTTTLHNLSQKISVEETGNTVEVEKNDLSADDNEFVIGDGVLPDGFVAISFAGKNLNILADYALGWNPIGRRLSPELGDRPLIGETTVKKINDLPAVDIYREYLGVYPDEFFISNICEFPFVVERRGINICMIPIDCGKDGELYFMMTLNEGEQIRFTFASHDEVLYASRKSLEDMEKFAPEALFLTLCGNRINFLKEDAHLEWDGFGSVFPNYALMHGACELYYHNGEGGILNSAHLSVGLREGDATSVAGEIEHPTLESLRHGRTLSLSDRMSTFLGRITNELLDTAVKAREASNAKSSFLSHMSHEIRTPINAIIGMDEMILQESKEADTLDYASSIRSAGNNLLSIVNDILDFSKIEAGKMNIVASEYGVTSLINDLYNVVRLRAEDKGLKVSLDIDPSIPSVLYGDVTRIRQVITNLLTNAVKYTEKGKVTLLVEKIPESGEDRGKELSMACPGEDRPEDFIRLKVSVKDTGIGIKPEDMERLFDEYARFDEKRNMSVEGTGLGMSICTELLDLMGSRLSVESTYGKGSEFGFEIMQGVVNEEPVGDKSGWFKKPAGRKQRVAFTAEDARILVVDDTPVNLVVMKGLLKKTKIKTDTASSGQEALELVKKNAYDVIFLDHMMPEMDGPETLKKMKELDDNMSKDAPVISLTANVLSNARDEYLAAGYNDYLSKPINLKDLEDLLFYYIPPEKVRTVQ